MSKITNSRNDSQALFDCCKQSLTRLLHPSIHPSIHPLRKVFTLFDILLQHIIYYVNKTNRLYILCCFYFVFLFNLNSLKIFNSKFSTQFLTIFYSKLYIIEKLTIFINNQNLIIFYRIDPH